MATELFECRTGDAPLVVSCPHRGTRVPAEILARMSERGKELHDTDWNVDKLYDFLADFGVTFLRANYSRYVADLNRDPTSSPLYPGQFETAMCPTVTFSGESIYRRGQEPSPDEISERRALYWAPYHQKLSQEMDRIKHRHGYAMLLDAHSILSHVPRLFEGKLPDLNLGTNSGKSCDTNLQAMAGAALKGPFSLVTNGRFKGGYITRHYGKPSSGIHALQLEICIGAYGDERRPREFSASRAMPLRDLLAKFVKSLLNYRPA